MRSLPMHLCHGNPRSSDTQEHSELDLTHTLESEPAVDSADRGFSLRYFHMRNERIPTADTLCLFYIHEEVVSVRNSIISCFIRVAMVSYYIGRAAVKYTAGTQWSDTSSTDVFSLFEHSLATLRECTIDRGERECHGEAAVTAACAQSVISAIPSQEIQRMIQEVQTLNEETLKVKTSTKQQILTKL